MKQDGSGIKVDGGMSSNDLLCQILADISGSEIVRPKMTEATALGAAMVAGYHMNFFQFLFKDLETEGASESDSELPLTPKTPVNGTAEVHEHTNGHATQPAQALPQEPSTPPPKRTGRAFRMPNGLIRSLTCRISSTALMKTTKKIERSFSLTRDIKYDKRDYDMFHPMMSDSQRQDRINTWKAAVIRSRKWIRVEKQEQKRIDYKRLSSVPFMLYVLMSFGTHILSERLVNG